MSYLVLARKFRPRTFSEITGQDHVTRTLVNAIKRGRVSHAFLFCGPRGVGKTSVARILSKALNCREGPTPEPCLECTNCKEIAAGISLAVREIDGASHNSVENVRDLIETLKSRPPQGSRYKIYIIDETHMLSIAAFNALLKNLEEPPPNTVFILATTEPHKVPDTVISRCQRHDFRAISPSEIEARLVSIAKEEGIEYELGALKMISRLAEGSMRDAQSLLDRVLAFGDGKLKESDAGAVLGVAEKTLLLKLSEAVFGRRPDDVLNILDEAFNVGLDPRLFADQFVSHWRDLLIAKFGGEKGLKIRGVDESSVVSLLRQVEGVSQDDLQDLVYLAREGADQAIKSSYPMYALEALAVRMATRQPVYDIAKLLSGSKVQNSVVDNKNRNAAQPSIERTSSYEQKHTLTGESTFEKWRSFVNFVDSKGKKAMSEILKKATVKEFDKGTLSIVGPQILVNYFEDRDNISIVEAFLNEIEPGNKWRLKVDLESEGDVKSGESIARLEKKAEMESRQKAIDAIERSEAIVNIKKVFPGSSIEH
ncbi:MAG: DNA polymerase III subunit gamma/tau [Candidatus Dadabacteria bacterium]|nr:MAG: DNA polymerase III subunit gamma/tau [Candidatus Dadabacteria bacterium]